MVNLSAFQCNFVVTSHQTFFASILLGRFKRGAVPTLRRAHCCAFLSSASECRDHTARATLQFFFFRACAHPALCSNTVVLTDSPAPTRPDLFTRYARISHVTTKSLAEGSCRRCDNFVLGKHRHFLELAHRATKTIASDPRQRVRLDHVALDPVDLWWRLLCLG